MKKDITFHIESDIAERFELAADIMKKDSNTLIENAMKKIIISTFSEIADEYSQGAADNEADNQENSNPKALKKIPMWADKQTQIPYKIIRAFFNYFYGFGSEGFNCNLSKK